MDTVAWPSISWTIFGCTFFESNSVAHVCRRSWKRIVGSPALPMRRRRFLLRTFEGLSGAPVSDVKTSPWSR